MFERIIYTSLWVLILAIIGVGGWLAYSNLNHDFVYESDRFADASEEEGQADDAVALNFDEPEGPAIGDSAPEEDVTAQEPVEQDTTDNAPASPGEHADLIAELEELIKDNIHMKVGSRGTRVGTVQKFLNVFQDASAIVDNDFGNGTKANVIEFQTDAGITADGEPGPQTYQAMIDWLEKNS